MPPRRKSIAAKLVTKQQSEVAAVDSKTGTTYKGFYIWTDVAPAVLQDPDLMFAKCLVLPSSTATVFKCKQVDPEDNSENTFDVQSTDAYNCNPNLDELSISDINMIQHTNVACVLDFLKQRYVKGNIYTTADPLLVVINPFKDLGNTTDAVIVQYRDAPDLSKMPPHVFSIARLARENLHGVHKSQTIIVCGESGAGKTEATKQIMRYFAAAKGQSKDARIQRAVLAANPVLEAFGNAKTMRNNNSSRFGRFMQLEVGPTGGIFFGCIKSFLLEKARIVTQENNERSYHIFYQLINGADAGLKELLGLGTVNDYKYINPHCTTIDGVDDCEEFIEVNQALDSMGITYEEKTSIFALVAGVLTFGNIEISTVEKQGVPDAAELSKKSKDVLDKACKLLGLKAAAVEEGLTVKYSTAGGETVRGYWKKAESEVLLQSLAKALYDRLFQWIIRRLNLTIAPPEGFPTFMGMLDIFGFEAFKTNSLEQLFINITNEVLQKNFTDVVFDKEIKLYKEEGITAVELKWTSNENIINVLTGKGASLISCLEDQCLAPGSTDEKFLSVAHGVLQNQPAFMKARVAPNVNFAVMHTIGEIEYCTGGFLAKNKDILRAELVEVVQSSTDSIAGHLFDDVVVERGKLGKGNLISAQFLASLKDLMSMINITEPHFIRCVKPNEEKKPMTYVKSKVLIQLHALSILEALQLKNLGYSYRRPFEEFLQQFKFVDLGVAETSADNPKAGAAKLLQNAKVGDGWQIGKTMVFMTPETVKLLARRQRECLAAWEPLVSLIDATYTRRKLYSELEVMLPSITRVQAHCRRLLATVAA